MLNRFALGLGLATAAGALLALGATIARASSDAAEQTKAGVLRVTFKLAGWVGYDGSDEAKQRIADTGAKLLARVLEGGGGLPRLVSSPMPPLTYSTALDSKGVAEVTYHAEIPAMWTHDRTGPIKADARSNLLHRLQAIDQRVIAFDGERPKA